jgi:hypothetical protein
LTVNYVMGVARVPAGFDWVKSIEPTASADAIRLRSHSGREVAAPLDVEFLRGTEEAEG